MRTSETEARIFWSKNAGSGYGRVRFLVQNARSQNGSAHFPTPASDGTMVSEPFHHRPVMERWFPSRSITGQ